MATDEEKEYFTNAIDKCFGQNYVGHTMAKSYFNKYQNDISKLIDTLDGMMKGGAQPWASYS